MGYRVLRGKLVRTSKTNYFWEPVEFWIKEENDEVSKITCEMMFERVNKETADKIIRDAGGDDPKICRAVVHEWRKFKDVDGADFGWNKENFEEFLSSIALAAETVRFWVRSLTNAAKKS